MKPTLLVLAAGMGSRYGSLKQMDGVGPSGEAILDYSVYDAIRGGFGKVVFVIRGFFADDFKAAFNEAKYGGKIKVEYVYQELDKLPTGFKVPEGREKPWGTNHAVMMGAPVIDGNFAVINADDFYGQDAIATMGKYLTDNEDGYSMVAYEVSRTLSENGTVSRGVCEVDSERNLVGMVERTKIECQNGKVVYIDDLGIHPLADNMPVSMNLFGFSKDYFRHSEEFFINFLNDPKNRENLKSEYYIPMMVNELVRSGVVKMKVLTTTSNWFGVTYKEDRPDTVAKVKDLIAEGAYPEKLFSRE